MKKGPSTSIETLDSLVTSHIELTQEVARLHEVIEAQERALAELEVRLGQYWELHEDVDYRSLVTRIREEARNVGDVIEALDIGTRRSLAQLGIAGVATEGSDISHGKRLLPTIHSLLRTLNEWK